MEKSVRNTSRSLSIDRGTNRKNLDSNSLPVERDGLRQESITATLDKPHEEHSLFYGKNLMIYKFFPEFHTGTMVPRPNTVIAGANDQPQIANTGALPK